MKNKIREYRKQQGISQETLSKKLNVYRQIINVIENNKLTLDKLGSMLLKLIISEWYNITSSYGYNPKIYIVR